MSDAVADRWAYAVKQFTIWRELAKPLDPPRTERCKPLTKRARRGAQKGFRFWQAQMDRMRNGEIGDRVAVAMTAPSHWSLGDIVRAANRGGIR